MDVVMFSISTISTVVCMAYVVLLDVFRHIVLENDSIATSILEIAFTTTLVGLAHYSTSLKKSTIIPAQVFLSILSFFFAYQMNRYYVAGVKYKSTNLDGKVYIITGSNTGLGFETAKHIASMGGTVVLACRSVARANAAKEQILDATKCSITKVFVLKLDLCGFDSVRKFVKEFRSLSLPLHGLINNAGVMQQDRNLTQDGFEMVFTANHLSHFLLTNLLLPELEKTGGRIVNITSCLHKSLKGFNFDDVMSERSYSLFGTYAQSKLANIMFTFELQRRMKEKGSSVTCNAVHPGCVRTDVTRNMGVLMRMGDFLSSPIMALLRKTPPEGAYTSIHVATAPELSGIGGLYFHHCHPVKTGPCAMDSIAQERLWKLSERLTGLSPS